jgi:hypothetical protein
MKYAICYRGISYQKDYANEYHLQNYNVDFYDALEFHKQNLINPLLEKGNEVDVFYNTYDSEMLSEYVNELNVVSVRTMDFQPNIKKYNWNNISNLLITTLEQVKEYQEKNNIKYDFIILNRFDIVIFRDFTKIFIPENAISVPHTNDDCFIVISGNLLDTALSIYKENLTKMSTHDIHPKFGELGVRYHIMFPHRNGREAGYNAGLWRLCRIMFTPDGHNVKEYNLQDVFNKKSDRYGFLYEPHKEFVDYGSRDWIEK